MSRAQNCVVTLPVDVQVGVRDLGRVHPDEQRGPVPNLIAVEREDVGEDMLQPLVEADAALRNDDGVTRQPAHRRTVPGHDGAPGLELSHRVERVAQRSGSQGRRLGAAERRLEARLDPPRLRRLGQHDDGVCGAGPPGRPHRDSTALMSRTVRTMPSGVPVTLERPARSAYGTSTDTTRQPASAARTTVSTG